MKECKKTFCKNNYAHYPKLKRYGEKCMHNGACSQLGIAGGANVINILDRPIKEGYQFVQKLADGELEYCIHTETRAGGISRLQAEKRRRQ